MHRRDLLRATIAASALAAPRIARAQAAKPLRFVPQSDVAALDPTITVGLVNRNHGFLIYDTLYGVDLAGQAQPQMLAGHQVEQDGKLWTMTLRDGLRFHDNEPVRARDVVASLRRWSAHDAFGASLFAVTDEIAAIDDASLR